MLLTLTRDELRELTKRQHADAQARWLAREGWPYVLDADNRPVVARAEWDRRMVASGAAPLPRRERRPALNWNAVR